MTGKKRGRPPGSKNRPKEQPGPPLTLVSLEDAYFNRPREQWPRPRYMVHADQRRAEVTVTDTETHERRTFPLASFLRPGEFVAAGYIDERGHPHVVYGEGDR